MAGLLYLPRLFVYHAQTTPGSEVSTYFKTMEHRLLRIIMLPAMLLTFFFGLLLYFIPGIVDMSDGWFHAKLFLVFLLAGLHGFMGRWYKEFRLDKRLHSARFFRIVNEIPALIMIAIVILVIVKPF